MKSGGRPVLSQTFRGRELNEKMYAKKVIYQEAVNI